MIAQTGALLSLALWPTVPVLIGASLVYGYGIGHITTLGPIVVRREFGAAAFGATYGTAASVIQLTSAFGPAVIGVLRDSFGGYRPGLAIASVVTLTGLRDPVRGWPPRGTKLSCAIRIRLLPRSEPASCAVPLSRFLSSTRHGAFRRADRRRRPLRHRRRLAPAGRAARARATPSSKAREAIGGTWDLFRYPGVRSDSDMYTLGYSLPAVEGGQGDRRRPVDPDLHPRDRERPRHRRARSAIGHQGRRAPRGRRRTRAGRSRSSAAETREPARFTCSFLCMCSGYYDYDGGYTAGVRRHRALQGPHRPSAEVDRRPRLRRQAVVVIGSGATAVTLVPAMADDGRARHHAAALADLHGGAARSQDPIANRLRRAPAAEARLLRSRAGRTCCCGMYFYQLCKRKPGAGRSACCWAACASMLGPDYDVETHFTPRYNPWDQRLCLVPDADLFQAIRARQGRRSSPTTSRRFTETGHQAEVRRGARGRHHRHRDRPEAAAARRRAAHGRRRAGRSRPRRFIYKGMMYSATCRTWPRRSATPTPRGR